MDRQEETDKILALTRAKINEFKANKDLVRTNDQIMTFTEFLKVFEFELNGRSTYEKACAFSFFVALTTNVNTIKKLRKDYNAPFEVDGVRVIPPPKSKRK